MKQPRSLLISAIFVTTVLLWAVANGAQQVVRKNGYIVYIGTYTRQQSKGIYAFRFDPATGKTTSIGLVAETANPSFLAIHPNRRFLYAVNEVASFAGQRTGSVSAYFIDPETGRLNLQNTVSSRGDSPCHLTVDQGGKWLFVANYGSGSVAVLPVREDGSLGEASGFMQHTGGSINPTRQQGPHAHEVVLSPDNRFALVPDLGLDRVVVYRTDLRKGLLAPNTPEFAKIEPGSGPRHLAFHPNGRFAYVINELQSTVAVLAYDPEKGSLEELQTTSTLPKDFAGNSTCAEIAVHPDGRFLYASNRGHDSIAVYAIDGIKGTLTHIEHVATLGKTPRSFAIDPTGAYLFAANQGSDNVVPFRIDRRTGHLIPTGDVLAVPLPVCVTFLDSK
jgi:6-phosphogluconolactonase